MEAVLLDAASEDGTAEAVKARFDHVTVLHGDGDIFWARGCMRRLRTPLPSTPLTSTCG